MKTSIQRRRLMGGAAAYAGLAWAGSAQAAAFPTKAVTLILPYPPGGASDSFVRAIQPSIAKSLGQALVLENKPGASALLGAIQIVQAPPDGHTLTLLPESAFRIPHLQKMPFDPLKDFTYIAHLIGFAFAVGVRADSPWKTWADLVADAKKRPGQISFGSAGNTVQYTMEELMQKAGVKLNNVPYKGEMDSVTALLGGHVDIAIASGTLTPHVASGKVRPLLMWTANRVKRYPNVPTMREAGYDMVSTAPLGVVGPKGMNPAVVKTLHDAFKKALEEPEGRAAMERFEIESAYLDSAEYTSFAHEHYEHQRKLIEKLGLRQGS
ncbi:tripartite tricarboxylate transporter substrate binding protein [Alicycliphilus sp. T452]|jgi:tripartite-type tricarboxylate transporter receptor subunit TctC